MADKTLMCIGCQGEFVFTEGEQKFYGEKGFKDPRRCKLCRQNKKVGESKTPEARSSTPMVDMKEHKRERAVEWINGDVAEDGGRGERRGSRGKRNDRRRNGRYDSWSDD